MKKLNLFLSPILWMGVIFILSSYQTPETTEFFWVDFMIKKTIHVLEYGFLWLLTYRALRNTSRLKNNALIITAILITVLYGLSDEWHQTFVPSRTGKLRDVGFDTLGALLMSIVVIRWLPSAPKRFKNWAKIWNII